MKKLFSLLLALALLVPIAFVIPAQAEEITKEPFYALGWSDFDEETYPHLDGLVTSNFSVADGKVKITYSKKPVVYGEYTDEDVTAFAQALKEKMESRPAGARYWHLWAPGRALRLAPENVMFLDAGVDQMTDLVTAIIKKLSEIKCPLDGLVLDTEYIGLSSWYIYSGSTSQPNNYKVNPNVYADIVNDPRYATQIRPLLEERGFPFWPNPSGMVSEIYSICNVNKGAEYDLARSIWDTVSRIHLNNYANKWCYEPLKKYYPDASLSDYQSQDAKPWFRLYESEADGLPDVGGSSCKVGTASSYSYYYVRPGQTFFEQNKQYASYNDAVFEASAFNNFLTDVNFTRQMYSSSKQIAPWITSYVYGGEKDSSAAYTPYYTELLYHLGLFDPEPFLSYTYMPEYKEEGMEASFTSPKYLATQQTMNDILAALTEVAGYSDRKPIELPQYWNAEYVVSGMYCNGRNLWRVTPNTDEISLEAFKVEGKDPTFSVKGQTITFPGGKILDDATISNVGSCGYWVETAKDVTPIMTADEDRYEKYPSFQENFDSYENGKLTTNKMAQTYAWATRVQEGDTAEAMDAGDGKALALTGNASFGNITIPAKITAGDSYAEEQTWQIQFTVPKGLSPEAEIHLLKYIAEGTEVFDNGITVRDGTVYYSQVVEDTYVEDKELTKIKPGTYTLKREMNFSDPDYFTYSVYLLNAKGKEIARVENVPCPTFRTITSILFLTKNADQAVLFDDYALYASGLATDFELYDAATGRNTEVETAVEGNAAYRLSWLNATDAEKKLEVVAAIYEGDALKEEKTVKTLTMKPGCDAIETGVVEVEEGQSVKVYLKGDVHSDVNETTPGEPVVSSGDTNIILIIAIAAAVLLAAAATLVICKKKKANVPEAIEAPAEPEKAPEEDDPEDDISDYNE